MTEEEAKLDAANLADELRSEQGGSYKAEEAFESSNSFGNCNLEEYELCRRINSTQEAAS